MTFSRLPIFLVLAAACAAPGCSASGRKATEAQAQNRVLTEQNRAQLAEIENLRAHNRQIEDQLIRTEDDLAMIEEQIGLDGEGLAAFRRDRAAMRKQTEGLANRRATLPPELAAKLAKLSERYPSLNFDPATGLSKLDTDVLFDSGKADLKRGASEMLAELARILKSSEGGDLKLMVVGHTDNRRIAGRPTREQYPNNFHLSTARALAVADALRTAGLDENRLGVAGFGPHQPVAPNVTPEDRRKNRRVEIFVMTPDVPVVGWTETMPSLY
jgi:chemotaxis protein MotB